MAKERDKKKKAAPANETGQKDEKPSGPSFTADQVLKGLVDPHRPELSAKERAKERGFMDTPGVKDFVKAQGAITEGSHFAEMLPFSKPHKKLGLEETEIRPAALLSTFEGMKDVYYKLKGRASPRTKDLLEGVDLEDMIKMLEELFDNEQLSRKMEARLPAAIRTEIGDDSGPLLTGLSDPRLSEPWRLFLEGWDIWVPDGEGDGVELFWEGEADDDDGEPIEILQVLRFKNGDIELETKLGKHNDCVTFDGESFFRLRAKAAK